MATLRITQGNGAPFYLNDLETYAGKLRTVSKIQRDRSGKCVWTVVGSDEEIDLIREALPLYGATEAVEG